MLTPGWFLICVAAILVLGIAASKLADRLSHSRRN